MELLEKIKKYCKSEKAAIVSGELSLSYKGLWEKSDQLAGFIKSAADADKKTPVVVYGHKHPLMLVAFLAAVKSGRAYVPIDINVPLKRVASIIEEVSPEVILTTEELVGDYQCQKIDLKSWDFEKGFKKVDASDYVKGSDVYYIIFTSGSTGNPKGVQITYDNLNHFVEWASSLGNAEKEEQIYLNQAPFSFDLSVMDLYLSLASGSTLWTLNKDVQKEYKKLFESLSASKADVWVSTPSFADLCLADPGFSESLLENLALFLFCGETLTNKTAGQLLERFPKASVYNTYGPTESTVAVTEVLIDEDIMKRYSPLPVGKAKPGTWIKIMENGVELPEGEKGEIVIVGNTVSCGYFNGAGSKDAFFDMEIDGEKQRAYHTGDKGYMKDGYLFYCGRLDLQIKLHGYRMELEDVEENLTKISCVSKAVVLPVMEDEKVKYLKAFCIYDGEETEKRVIQKLIKKEMKTVLPEYMIPKKIVTVDEIPMTPNGKADRKKLKELLV